MLVGRGSVSTVLTSTDVDVLLAEALQAVPSAGQRVLGAAHSSDFGDGNHKGKVPAGESWLPGLS